MSRVLCIRAGCYVLCIGVVYCVLELVVVYCVMELCIVYWSGCCYSVSWLMLPPSMNL